MALLHPDAVWLTDSDGRSKAARKPVVGADKVGRLLLGLLERYGEEMLAGWTPVQVNGELGFRSPAFAETGAGATVLSIRDGRIAAVYMMINPEKLPQRVS